MQPNRGWGNKVQKAETIGGDRRSDKRYGMQLQLRWKLIRRRREIDAGTGRTIDMSSGGVLFEMGCEVPPGLNVELSIAWPMLLHNVAPLQLVVMGRVVRASSGRVAIRTTAHEFRTMGMHTSQRPMPTNGRTPGMLMHTENSTAPAGIR